MPALLEVENLSVRFETDDAELTAVSELSFAINENECVGVVGESGSGKSQTFMAVLGLLAANGTASGSARFRGREILNAPRRELDEIRGRFIAMVFQDALSGLTPTMRVGRQLIETAQQHLGMNGEQARNKTLEMLNAVSLPDPERCLAAYPFELSGGMRQRVMIALAMICGPDVLIADEPTTALDVTIQAQVLNLLDELKRQSGASVVLITHDLAVAAGICDRILIMYGGRLVESGPAKKIFNKPRHPYTIGLLNSLPRLEIDTSVDLPTIPGQAPDPGAAILGCAFAERCSRVIDRCRTERPNPRRIAADHAAACHLAEK